MYFKERLTKGKMHSFEGKGGKILIVGNGPSAGNLDYDYYKNNGYEIMCVNNFAVNMDLMKRIKPRFYCYIDDVMYIKENLKTNKELIRLCNSLNEVDWEMEFVCRYGQIPPIKNPYIRIAHVNNCVLKESFKSIQFSRYEVNKACPGFQNVICCCLYFAISSNFSDILLTGVEFDMHKELNVAVNNDVIREYTHFYGVNSVNITQAGQIRKGEIYKYFYFSYLTLLQYKILYDYSLYKGVNVKNLTVNSTIDSIPKSVPIENCNDNVYTIE